MKKIYACLILIFVLSGCQSMYYGAMEQVGYHKRDIMVDRIEQAQSYQKLARTEFASALEEMQTLVKLDNEDLQSAYEKARDEYLASHDAAEDVTDQIDKVEDVATALFDEWTDEISQIANASLRQKSEQKLRDTRRHYEKMLRVMQLAESKMHPVLQAMRDNMLYLKHNLNAQAIAAIKTEFVNLQFNIVDLIRQMDQSIAESNEFIATLSKP